MNTHTQAHFLRIPTRWCWFQERMGPLCQQSLETAGRLGEEDGRGLRWPAAQKPTGFAIQCGEEENNVGES